MTTHTTGINAIIHLMTRISWILPRYKCQARACRKNAHTTDSACCRGSLIAEMLVRVDINGRTASWSTLVQSFRTTQKVGWTSLPLKQEHNSNRHPLILRPTRLTLTTGGFRWLSFWSSTSAMLWPQCTSSFGTTNANQGIFQARVKIYRGRPSSCSTGSAACSTHGRASRGCRA